MKMRKYFIGLGVLAGAVILTFVFLGVKAAGARTVHPVEAAGRRTIEEKVVASGSIIPEREVEVKSPLSGVVDAIYAVPGEPAQKGEALLAIRVVASSLELGSSEAAFEKASIRLRTATADMEKMKSLFDRELIAEAEYRSVETTYQIALEDYKEARNRIALIKEGISAGKRSVANVVRSPIAGTVLDIPVKLGAPVQESGTYAAGTTVAYVADMNSLRFEGEIDEGQIDSLRKGMEAKITLAAIEQAAIPGKVSFLSPRGSESNGTIKFKIRIAITVPTDVSLRAGYSANAEIILNRAEKVICVKERDTVTEDGKSFVEVEKAPQEFEKREVTIGVSDGLYTEITSGLAEGEKVKSLKALAAK